MATITGRTGAQYIIDAGSNDGNGSAANLAAAITAGLADGTLTQTDNTNPPAGAGFFATATAGTTVTLEPAVRAAALTGSGPVSVAGSGGQNQQILAGGGGLFFYTNGGSGAVVTGDGDNTLGTPYQGAGPFPS